MARGHMPRHMMGPWPWPWLPSGLLPWLQQFWPYGPTLAPERRSGRALTRQVVVIILYTMQDTCFHLFSPVSTECGFAVGRGIWGCIR